jgi:hypothetical protein
MGIAAEYEAELKSAASDIIEAWHNAKSDLSTDIRDALFGGLSQLSSQELAAHLGGGRHVQLVCTENIFVPILYQNLAFDAFDS